MEQENQKKFLVFKIIAFEPGSANSHIVEQDTSRWQPICYQGTRRFKISIFHSRFSRSDEKYNENALIKILQEFGTL